MGEDDDLMGTIGIELEDSDGGAEAGEEPGYDPPAETAAVAPVSARDLEPQAIAARVAAEVREMLAKRVEFLVAAAVEEAVSREIQKLKKFLAEG